MPGLCCGCWDLSSGPLIVEQMLLTTELCLSPTALLSSALFFFWVIKTISNKAYFLKIVRIIDPTKSQRCVWAITVSISENSFCLLFPEAHRESLHFTCTILKDALACIQKHLIIYTFSTGTLALEHT